MKLTPARERVLRRLLLVYHDCLRPWLDADAWSDLCCPLYPSPWRAWPAFVRLLTGMDSDGLVVLEWDADGASVDLSPLGLRALMEARS